MKKLLLLILFVAGFSATANAARLKIPVCTDCEYIEPVADLPDSAEFYSEEHKAFADVAFMYKQFWVVGIPVWNYDEQHILRIKDQDVYFEVSEEELKQYQEKYQLGSLGNPISVWNMAGGKIILLIITAGIVWVYTGDKKEKEPVAAKEELFK